MTPASHTFMFRNRSIFARDRRLFLVLAGLTILVGAACQSPPLKQEEPKTSPPQSAGADAQKLFQEGKRLVEANCGDCADSTRAGLERGVKMLERSLDQGFPHPDRALKLLESAYRGLMLIYAEPDSEERAQLRKRHDQVLERWLAVSPDDPDALLESAHTLDPKASEAIARRVLKLEPNRAEADYLLGISLVDQGKVDEGILHLRRAYENADWNRRDGIWKQDCGSPQDPREEDGGEALGKRDAKAVLATGTAILDGRLPRDT